jgi:16S rRNA processing protein RimM
MANSDNQQQELEHEEAGQTPASAPVFLILGRILRPHGIRGELRLQIVTQFPERISSLEKVYIGEDPYDADSATVFEIDGARRHHDQVLVRLKEITTRNEAEIYRNQLLMVAFEDAVPLEDDEYYLFQIIGADVVTKDGTKLGRVSEILETGANDVFLVKGGIYGEVLVPDIDDVVLDIDIDRQLVTVDLPPGLLPD